MAQIVNSSVWLKFRRRLCRASIQAQVVPRLTRMVGLLLFFASPFMAEKLLEIATARGHAARVLFGEGADDAVREANMIETAVLEQDTAYGPILKTFTVQQPTEPTPSMTFRYACPKALLFVMLHISTPFLKMCEACVQADGVLHMILYQDDVRPGNALRPDLARSYYCFLWTFLNFPKSFLVSDIGWFDLLYALVKQVKKLKGGASLLFERLFQLIFDEPWVLNIHRDGDQWRIAVDWAVMLADMKALAQTALTKGAGGYKCCPKCDNCMGRLPAGFIAANADIGGFVHYTSDDIDAFVEHTAQSLGELCDAVKEAWVNGAAGQAEELETLCGVTYNGGLGVPWGRSAGQIQFPERLYYDSMHTLYSSGGIAQFECNQILVRIKRRIPKRQVQEFFNHIKLTGGELAFDFFQRVRNSAKKHVKAFASEVLVMIPCIMLFLDMVVGTNGAFANELKCFQLLYCIRFILEDNDLAVDAADSGLLDRLIREHHVLFLQLYRLCRRPKLHFLLHLPKLIRRWRRHLDCFAAERHHRKSKRRAHYIFKNLGTTLLRRTVTELLQEVQKPHYFEPFHIASPLVRGQSRFRFLMRELGYDIVCRGNAMSCPVGKLAKNTFVIWKDGQGLVIGGVIQELFQVTVRGGRELQAVCAVVQAAIVDRTVSANRWKFRRGVLPSILSCQRIVRRLDYVIIGDELHVLVPHLWNELICS